MSVRFAASALLRRNAASLLRLSQRGESAQVTREREAQIEYAVNSLHDRLTVLASPGSDGFSRKLQLEAIMKKGAQTGVLLLLQPATYKFEWFMTLERSATKHGAGEQTGRRVKRKRRIMTFPVLLRTGDNSGRQLRNPEVLCKPEYAEDDYATESSKGGDQVRGAP